MGALHQLSRWCQPLPFVADRGLEPQISAVQRSTVKLSTRPFRKASAGVAWLFQPAVL